MTTSRVYGTRFFAKYFYKQKSRTKNGVLNKQTGTSAESALILENKWR